MTESEFEAAMSKGSELLKRLAPYTEIAERLMLKCEGDRERLSQEERSELDAAVIIAEPIMNELFILQSAINSYAGTRLD